jgi:hypothetical protein
MSKPQWLKDREANVQRAVREPDLCVGCIYYGKFCKWAKHKNNELVEVHECDIHPNCLNTKYSICCDDFMTEQLV